MMACIKRNPEMAKLLMENCDKVTLNMKDNKDCTALVHAIQHLPDLIPAFIRKGALLHTVDKEKRTPLMLACRKNEEVAKTKEGLASVVPTRDNINRCTVNILVSGNDNEAKWHQWAQDACKGNAAAGHRWSKAPMAWRPDAHGVGPDSVLEEWAPCWGSWPTCG